MSIASLQSLLNKIPNSNCEGKCQESCGPIIVSRIENRSIEKYCKENKTKFKAFPTKLNPLELLKHIQDPSSCTLCHYLKNNKCSIYKVRPAICRMWGTVKEMPCEWGCKPDKIMSTQESFEILEALGFMK